MSKSNRETSRAERAAAAVIAQHHREQRRRALILGGVLGVLLLIVIGIIYGINSRSDTSGKAATPPGGVTDTYGVVVGDASAPKTITVYEDFQCPICRDFEATTRDKVAAAVDAGKVKVDYRMVAFLDRASTTNYSSRALNAAAVVLDTSGVDVFRKFHDLLYENQPEEGSAGLSDAKLIEYAVQAGAKESAVRPGIEGDDFHQWTINATDQMSKNGVNGTPTVFIDGKSAGTTLADAIQATTDAIG